MESGDTSNTDDVPVDKYIEELSEIDDDKTISERSYTPSIGKLQHEIKMLSIKVLEKDMELKNLKADAFISKRFNPVLNQNDSIIQASEAEKLRNFLIEHDFSDPFQHLISREDFVRLTKLPKSQMSLIDLVKFRHFQDILSTLHNVAKTSQDMSVQTEQDLEFSFDKNSSAQKEFILEEANQHLTNQIAVLEEKLKLKQNELKEAEKDRSDLLQRTIRAENGFKSLQNEYNQLQKSFENRLPISFFEEFLAFEQSQSEQKNSELTAELQKLHAENEDLLKRLQVSENEVKNLEDRLQSVSAGSRYSSNIPSDILSKSRIISLEIQLNVAEVAKKDALRQVEQLTEKLDAASKAVYKVEAQKKIEVSRLEAELSIVSQKLATYERLEAELDQAIESFQSNRAGANADVSNELMHLTSLTDKNGHSILPTLASRRLEHCIDLSRRLSESEKMKGNLQEENEELKSELQLSRNEAKRLSELLTNMDKPTNGLAAALVERNSEINNLQTEKQKLERKLKQLYKCTKDIMTERNAMLADMKGIYKEISQQKHEQELMEKQLHRKVVHKFQS